MRRSKSLTDLKRLEPDNDFLADNLEKIIFSSKKRFKKDSKKFVEKNIAELDDIAKGIASDAENNQRIANNYKTQFNKFHLASVNLNATIDNFIKVNRANTHNVSIATCSILDRTSNMKEDIKKLIKNNYNTK